MDKVILKSLLLEAEVVFRSVLAVENNARIAAEAAADDAYDARYSRESRTDWPKLVEFILNNHGDSFHDALDLYKDKEFAKGLLGDDLQWLNSVKGKHAASDEIRAKRTRLRLRLNKAVHTLRTKCAEEMDRRVSAPMRTRLLFSGLRYSFTTNAPLAGTSHGVGDKR